MKKWKKSIKWRNYSKKLEKKRNNRYNLEFDTFERVKSL